MPLKENEAKFRQVVAVVRIRGETMAYEWPSKDRDRPLFPLRTVGAVRGLFEAHLSGPQPNLALLSIVAGHVENTLTACTAHSGCHI